MEFLKLVRKRSFLSEILYAALNIALAIAILLVVRYTGSVFLAIGLMLLSKWRTLAVRPRYWLANIRANLVDVIVGISVVAHLMVINGATMLDSHKLILMTAITALYIIWLLAIKPRSNRAFIAVQAGVSVLFGVSALFVVSAGWPASVVVLLMWVIGYTSAYHVLNAYDKETHALFLSLVWGLVMAEFGWIAYHWVIAYELPFIDNLLIPQAAIFATLVSFTAYKIYDSFMKHERIRSSDVILPILFSVAIIIVMLALFNSIPTVL